MRMLCVGQIKIFFLKISVVNRVYGDMQFQVINSIVLCKSKMLLISNWFDNWCRLMLIGI